MGIQLCRKHLMQGHVWPELHQGLREDEMPARVTFGYSLFPNSSFPGSFHLCNSLTRTSKFPA